MVLMASPVLIPGLDVAADRGGGVQVVARDRDRAADLARVDQGAQRDHLARLVADLEQVEVLDLVAIARRRPGW